MDGVREGFPGAPGLMFYALPATPIRLPSGSVKWPITRPLPGASSGPIRRIPPRLSAFWSAASTSGNSDVEDHAGVVAQASAHAARDPAPIAGRAGVHEPVVGRLGYRPRDLAACVELPSEEAAVVAPQVVRVLPDDLEVHNCMPHGQALSVDSWELYPLMIAADRAYPQGPPQYGGGRATRCVGEVDADKVRVILGRQDVLSALRRGR